MCWQGQGERGRGGLHCYGGSPTNSGLLNSKRGTNRRERERGRGMEGGCRECQFVAMCPEHTILSILLSPPTPSLPRCTPEKNATSKSEIFVRQLIKNFSVPRVCVCASVCESVCQVAAPKAVHKALSSVIIETLVALTN